MRGADTDRMEDFSEQKLGFKEQENNVVLIKGSHLLAKLELVGR